MQPSIRSLACTVAELLDLLDLAHADVIGYSFGGAVAQELALRSPDRVKRLVLAASTTGWGGVPGHLNAMLLVATPWRYYSRRHYERTIGVIAGGRARHDESFVTRRGDERLQHPPHPVAYLGQLIAGCSWSSLGRLPRMAVPTLVVSGTDDPLIPPVNSVLLAARIPAARLVLVDDGHLLLLDERSAALVSIAAFLDGDTVGAEVDEDQLARALAQSPGGPPPWSVASGIVRMINGC